MNVEALDHVNIITDRLDETAEFYGRLLGLVRKDAPPPLTPETATWMFDAENRAMAKWIYRELGPDVPLHFTAFHPDFKMTGLPPTPASTLARARRIAIDEGLHFVYTGNLHDREGGTTSCPSCRAVLVERDWYRIEGYRITPEGRCPDCGTPVPGRFGAFDARRQWGRKRIPVAIGR